MTEEYEYALCCEKPTVVDIEGYYVLVFQRNPELETVFVKEYRNVFELLSLGKKMEGTACVVPEWKLPAGSGSQIVEYRGRRIRFSKTRLGILRCLLLKGSPATFHEIAMAGWEEPTDIECLVSMFVSFHSIQNKRRIVMFLLKRKDNNQVFHIGKKHVVAFVCHSLKAAEQAVQRVKRWFGVECVVSDVTQSELSGWYFLAYRNGRKYGPESDVSVVCRNVEDALVFSGRILYNTRKMVSPVPVA